MKTPIQYALDVTAALLLIGALGAVFRMDREAPAVDAPEEAVIRVEPVEAPPTPPPPPPLKIAVTYCPKNRHEYDDMGKLLDQLGQGYEYTKIHLNDLLEAEKLLQYDVVFATCGTFFPPWIEAEVIGKGDRPNTTQHPLDQATFDRAKVALRKFVGSGKTLYASDHMYPVIDHAFDEFTGASGDEMPQGARQTVEATVVDPGLREHIGPSLALRFDQTDWSPAAFDAQAMTVYLRGDYEPKQGRRQSAPLLVKLPFEQGALFFTSFHNEKQNSQQELELLKYLVFATVTAREATRVNEQMARGGFSPQKQSLLSASGKSQSATQVFKSTKAGRLRFVLGFEDRGARLRLTVTGPDGKTHGETEGTSTVSVEVPDAPAGDWKYTVTALEVPYANFPFTVTVGEK